MRYILLFSLFIGSLSADAKVFIGLKTALTNETYEVNYRGQDESVDVSALAYGVKLGYGNIRSYALEVSFLAQKFDKNVFSDSDSVNYLIDFDLIKSFDFGFDLLPFIKAGFGTGEMYVNRNIETYVNNGYFKIGGGVYYTFYDVVDIELGTVYFNSSWTSLDLGSELKSTSNGYRPYGAINVRF